MLGRPTAPGFWRIAGRDYAVHLFVCIASVILAGAAVFAIGALAVGMEGSTSITFIVVTGLATVVLASAVVGATLRARRVVDLFLRGEPVTGTVGLVRRFRGQNALQLRIDYRHERESRTGWIALTDCDTVRSLAVPESRVDLLVDPESPQRFVLPTAYH